jgi:Icc-related predicted phosphoesterase
MRIISNVDWQFPPTLNRKGYSRDQHDIKTVLVVESDLYNHPTIAMSDIHSHTAAVIERLKRSIDLSKCTVITAGDMAGQMVFGSDGDPTADLLYLNSLSDAFYFVHGNHDVPAGKELCQVRNRQGKQCSLHMSGSHMFGGVDGTISNKTHINKFPKVVYLEKLEKVLKSRPYTLVTHETPSLPNSLNSRSDPEWEPYLIGNRDVFEMVNKYKPKVHMYGHCHHPLPFYSINGVQYINLDGRIIIFVTSEAEWNSINTSPL